MALVMAGAMFKVYPGKFVHNQEVKLRPVEHHYEKEGESPYIKYGCQICEQITKETKGLHFEDKEGNDVTFSKFSFPEGTSNCPCCGIKIDWSYKSNIIGK